MTYEGNLPALPIWLILGVASLFAPVEPLVARRPNRPA